MSDWSPGRRDADDAVLAVPRGWRIARISRDRLTRQLARSDERVSGVVAPRRPLAPGASFRVTAERYALVPETSVAPASGLEVDGAVLVRPEVAFDVHEGVVTVARGELLVDLGAAAHDPSQLDAALQSASPRGRSPFPNRPLVVFLGTERDRDVAGWARDIVNDLVLHQGTEGRLAVPEAPAGPHLTRPCAPTEASIVALAPDVIVALDDDAVESGTRWLHDNRSAVIIQLTPGTGTAIELVTWRIGRARGRLRARVRRGVDGRDLAQLVRRLCAGPQPQPPRDRSRHEPRARKPRPAASPCPGALDPYSTFVALLGAASTADDARYDGFADAIDACGGRLLVARPGAHGPGAAATADVLFVRSLTSSDGVLDLVRARRASRRTTVLDVGPIDVVRNDGPTADASAAAVELAEAGGAAMTTSPRLQAQLRAAGIRTLVVPSLMTRARAASLVTLRRRSRDREAAVLGWYTGARRGFGKELGAGLALISELLAIRPGLTVEIVGDGTDSAQELARHDRVVMAPGAPNPRTVARWTAQLWTTEPTGAEVDGDLFPVVEASYLGVPTFVTNESPAAREGLVGRDLLLEGRTDADAQSIARQLDDAAAWSVRSDEAARLAEALYGPRSAVAVLNRVFGWLRFGLTK